MRIAVINETSAGDRNADVLKALEGRGHEIFNCGMTKGGQAPELTYIHTGLLAGLPAAGAWMVRIKQFFGWVLIAMGEYFVFTAGNLWI